jgi:hypothetical protein
MERDIEILKNKIQAIVDSLARLHQSHEYPDLVAQFHTLVAQFSSLEADLPYLVHAHIVPPTDPDFFPRVLFRTKLAPEIEDWVSVEPSRDLTSLELEIDQMRSYRSSLLEMIQELREAFDAFKIQRADPVPTPRIEPILKFMHSGVEMVETKK